MNVNKIEYYEHLRLGLLGSVYQFDGSILWVNIDYYYGRSSRCSQKLQAKQVTQSKNGNFSHN